MSGSQTWFPKSLVVRIGRLTPVEPVWCVLIPPAFLCVRKSSDELFPVFPAVVFSLLRYLSSHLLSQHILPGHCLNFFFFFGHEHIKRHWLGFPFF